MKGSYQRFAKNVLTIVATNAATALSSIILLPMITKTLGAYGFGIWKQVEVTTSLLLSFVGLGLPYALTRFLPAKTERSEIRDEFYSAFFLVLLSSLVFSGIIIIFANFIAGAFFDGATEVVRVTGFVILASSLQGVFLGLFRSFQQMKRYFIFVVADVYCQLGVIAYLTLTGHGVLSIVLVVLSVKVITLFPLFLLVRSQIGFGKPSFGRVREYLNFGIPIIPSDLGSWLITSGDRYVIGYILGAASVGIYSVSYSIGSITYLLSRILLFVLPPALSGLYDRGRIDEVKVHLSYSLKYLLAIAIPFTFGAAILSKPVLTLFSTSDIANEGYLITPIIALSTLVLASLDLSGQILVLVKKTRILGTIWIIGGLINLVLNILIVPHLGIMGAAISTLVAYTLIGGLVAYYSFRQFSFSIDWRFIIKSLIASGIMSLAIWQMSPEGTLATLGTVMVGVLTYATILFLLRGFAREELVFFKRLLRRD